MRKLKFFVNRNPMFDRCPSCKDLGSLHKSRARNTRESVIKTFTIWKLYRCKSCGWRGYRSVIILTSRSFITLAYYIGIIAVVAFIVFKVLNSYNN